MRKLNCRHLPVVDGPRIIGILSIRDLYSKIHVELQEDLRLRDHLFRSGYSMTY
jgi:CBS domain-containing protein